MHHPAAGGGQGGDDQTRTAGTADQIIGGQAALQAEHVAEQRLYEPGEKRGQQRHRHQGADQKENDAAKGPRARR